jgi:predicted DNA-binding helix-hairpin-helix protein
MDAVEKLKLLAPQMGLESAEDADTVAHPQGVVDVHTTAPCGHSPAELRRVFDSLPSGASLPPDGQAMQTLTKGAGDPAPGLHRKAHSLGVSYAQMPGGQKLPMLKTLLTSACERDCYYCPWRARRNFRRATFKPEEMAAVFTQMRQSGMVEGLFLSSGIAGGGVRTQDRLLDTATILRHKHDFRGYLHLKLMPGLERDQLVRAMQLANRVSINLEAPNTARLQKLAPHKIFLDELLQPLKWADEIRRLQSPHTTLTGRWPSLVTQMVVGAVGESDLEIMTTTAYVTQKLRLARVYFSAFRPVSQTPLEDVPAENPWREHRLYQASFLLRDYGFDLEDLPFTEAGRLPLEMDPKLAWARQNLNDTPVEINRADRRSLLRVPGIGPKGVEAILQARRQGHLRELRDLQALGVQAKRAAPFILLDGRQPTHQLRLF